MSTSWPPRCKLAAEDSGAPSAPIIWRARPGEEVRLSGGVRVTNFQPVTDPAVLKRLDKSARGKVVQADFARWESRIFGQIDGANRLELFFQDKPMTLARWPNEGFAHVVDVVGGAPLEIHGRRGDKIGRFTYEGDRPNRWVGEKDVMASRLLVLGLGRSAPTDCSRSTRSSRVIALAPPYHVYGYRKGQWYYAFNLLCELDAPGEWYLDRASGILYFWPPAPLDQGKAVVSVTQGLLYMENAAHISFRNLIFEACRWRAIEANQVTDVQIVGCTIRNTGSWAVSLSGSNSGVVGCDIYATGEGGIALMAATARLSLPPDSWPTTTTSTITAAGIASASPAILLNGVGNRAAHNLIDNAPHQAIGFGGNDHLIEFNEIHSVCYESNDAGAIYAGRNWTMRGTVIRHNYFHDISGFEGRGCVGVYLDDQFSGTEIFGNLFYKVTRAAMIGGGRDCTIANNIFVDCAPAMHVDARGLGWAAHLFDTLKQGLQRSALPGAPLGRPLSQAGPYPRRRPHGAQGQHYRPQHLCRRPVGRLRGKAKPMVTFQDNLLDQDPRFVDNARPGFPAQGRFAGLQIGLPANPPGEDRAVSESRTCVVAGFWHGRICGNPTPRVTADENAESSENNCRPRHVSIAATKYGRSG